MAKKYWKSQGILSVRKSGNPDWMFLFSRSKSPRCQRWHYCQPCVLWENLKVTLLSEEGTKIR